MKLPQAGGQDFAGAPGPLKVPVIPDRFFQIQDDTGFFWQAFGNGALASGEVQYLQSGLNLVVDEVIFAPEEAHVREPGAPGGLIDLRLDEKRGDYEITRNLWFDTRRSGVRVLDTITNTSGVEQRVSVALRTTYPFAWQSLHGSGGGILTNEPVLQLSARDFSLGVHFSSSEGRHDTLFLLGSEKGGVKPDLKASSNSRELTFLYHLTIPPKESRALLHWILQRNLSEVSHDLAALSPFLQRDRLIFPGVDSNLFERIVNFGESAFQAEPAAPAQLRSLVALNLLTDRIGLHRRAEDLLWISPTNQISGSVDRGSSLTVETAYSGEQVVGLAEIAAIRGGAGIGRLPLIYLRDGRVFSGRILEGEIRWTLSAGTQTASGGTENLEVEDLNLLLLATGPSDGVAPPKTTHFLQLINGSVLPLVTGPADTLDLITPWGGETWKWADLLEANHVSQPSPRFRVSGKGGAILSSFLPVRNLTLETALGRSVEVPTTAIDRIWAAGATPAVSTVPVTERWLDFSEVPAGLGPETGFLVTANNLVDGGFASPHLLLVVEGNEFRIESDRVTAMRRPLDPGSEKLVEVELVTGEKLTGEFASPYVEISRNGGVVKIPVTQFLAFRNGSL